MLAVKGLYNDGQIVFKKKLLFEEFSGRMIDVKAEKMEALDRRYESMERYVRD